MHKNRIIIILGIFIILIEGWSGFTPDTKRHLVEIFAAIIVILAFLIEKKGVFFLDWHKKSPVTPVASTYVEHNGAVAAPAPIPPVTTNPSPEV